MSAKRPRREPAENFTPFLGLSDQGRHELVAEAFHTFGEEAAYSLALLLDVEIEDCAEAIERTRHRPH